MNSVIFIPRKFEVYQCGSN